MVTAPLPVGLCTGASEKNVPAAARLFKKLVMGGQLVGCAPPSRTRSLAGPTAAFPGDNFDASQHVTLATHHDPRMPVRLLLSQTLWPAHACPLFAVTGVLHRHAPVRVPGLMPCACVRVCVRVRVCACARLFLLCAR